MRRQDTSSLTDQEHHTGTSDLLGFKMLSGAVVLCKIMDMQNLLIIHFNVLAFCPKCTVNVLDHQKQVCP